MAIFNGYVKLPEGKSVCLKTPDSQDTLRWSIFRASTSGNLWWQSLAPSALQHVHATCRQLPNKIVPSGIVFKKSVCHASTIVVYWHHESHVEIHGGHKQSIAIALAAWCWVLTHLVPKLLLKWGSIIHPKAGERNECVYTSLYIYIIM